MRAVNQSSLSHGVIFPLIAELARGAGGVEMSNQISALAEI